MATCLGDVIRPEAAIATVRLLRRLGHQVDFPRAQTCCGQPMFNSGYAELARHQAKHTIEVSEGDNVIVVPSGSCAAMVKVEFPHLFEEDESWLTRAKNLAERTYELSDLLVNKLGVVDVGARFEGRVAYHYACHLRLLEQQNEVRQLIENVEGTTYVDIERQDQCCGFGGSFAVRYGEISSAMVNDKVSCILASGADAVVSTDAGCLMNIGGPMHRQGDEVEVLHIAELLERR